MKAWLDYQNDVKVSDVQLAAREGYESVEHAKRYTTLGMATDQGKLSNINGLAVLSEALNAEIPQVGTTTFRPPYTPISMGAIAGEARGALFQPVRQTPIHGWHDRPTAPISSRSASGGGPIAFPRARRDSARCRDARDHQHPQQCRAAGRLDPGQADRQGPRCRAASSTCSTPT